jgi:hypothetical protein
MKKIGCFILSAIILQGCASITAGRHRLSLLSEIDVDMDKQMIQKIMGKPKAVRVGKKISDDKIYELHEYKLYDDNAVFMLSWFLILPADVFLGTESFWFHYINSKLVFWGEEGDWRGAPKWFSTYYAQPSSGQPDAGANLPEANDTK